MSFDLLDLADLSGALGTIVTGNRVPLAPHITTVGTALRLYSDDGQRTNIVSTGISVPQDFTFEFDITPVTLPDDLSDTANHLFFLSAQDAQDDIAGLVIAKSGIAFVNSEGDTVVLVPNSDSLFSETTRSTVRLVVDGTRGIIDLYVTPTVDVSTIGHQLRFTTATRTTPPTVQEGFSFTVIGQSGDIYEMLVHTLRLSTSLLIPNRRPVGVAADTSGVVGQAIVVDGSTSYDPEGEPITYAWSFVSTPTGSAITDSDLFATKFPTYTGTTDPAPAFVPDIIGTYVLQLLVNDGLLNSTPLEVIVTAASSFVEHGYVPDATFIFNLLSDFWDDVDDREVLLSFWSSIMQIAASDLLMLYQNDRNKSINTIGRRIQRKWLDFDARIEFEEVFTTAEEVSLSGTSGAIQYVEGNTLESFGTTTVESSVSNFVTQQIQPGARIHMDTAPYTAKVVNVISPTQLELDTIVPTAVGVDFSVGSKRSFTQAGTDFSVLSVGQVIHIFSLNGDVVRQVSEVYTDYIILDADAPADINSIWQTDAVRAYLSSPLPNDFRILQGDLGIWLSKDKTTLQATELLTEVIGAVGSSVGTTAGDLASEIGDPNKELVFIGIYRTSQLPILDMLESIPTLQSIIKDPPDTDLLKENVNFTLGGDTGDRYISFNTPYTLANPPPDTFWGEYVFLGNNPTIAANFGNELGLPEDATVVTSLDFDYLTAVTGLLYCYLFGPSVDNLRIGAQIFVGLPFAAEAGTIVRIEDTYTTELGRITIQGSEEGLLRTYFYKRILGIEVNPETDLDYAEGDKVVRFAPLSKGVQIIDRLIDEIWWKGAGVREVEKYFTFMLGVNVDVIDDPTKILDLLTVVIDFVRRVKPVYTEVVTVLQRFLDDSIDVTDSMSACLTLMLAEKVCPDSRLGVYGELKSSGDPQWQFGSGLTYGHGNEICPKDELTVVGCATGGGPISYGSVFRYGDPIQYGGTAPPGEICTTLVSTVPALPGSGPTGEK